MFDIKDLKDKVKDGSIALNHGLEHRLLNDKLTDNDYTFLSRTFDTMRKLSHGHKSN